VLDRLADGERCLRQRRRDPPRRCGRGRLLDALLHEEQSDGITPFLVVPASTAVALQASAPLEEVHLLRDETADMAWAIERIVEGPLGDPVTNTSVPAPAAAPASLPAALAYQLAGPLPANWFPLLPTADGLALVAGTVEGSDQAPASRLLQRLSTAGFQLPQHEISRSGLRLDRVANRTRTSGGDAKLWVARRRHIGAGEASSGLRYDEAIPAGQED
jgi:hypothetical protein